MSTPMSTPPGNVLYYGKYEPPPQQVRLQAGAWALVYEDGDLRYISVAGREVLRRIYVAVRDRNWDTVPNIRSDVRIETSEDAFRISYDTRNLEGDIDFAWQGTIAGDSGGNITFTMEGIANTNFLRNRIGFCVLHPARECAGAPCVIEKTDGTMEHGAFPLSISPHQPFVDIRTISHQVLPHLWAEVRFCGDVFEMEDQRNWTDASFKTYCTPLRLPFPVQVEKGAVVRQSVTLSLRGSIPEMRADVGISPQQLSFSVSVGPAIRLPAVGLGLPHDGHTATSGELARLRALNLSHLRVDLDLSKAGYAAVLSKAAAESSSLGVPLEVALTVSDAAEEELRALAGVLVESSPAVRSWLIFHKGEKSTRARWVELSRRHLGSYSAHAQIGAGTNAFFAELNREHPPVQAIDMACYSVNPQVHAFDNASLVETLEAQGTTVSSARTFIGELPLAVTPVTLKPRFNPNATGSEPVRGDTELPPQVDSRQMSLFGAGWTLGSLKHLSENGADSLTYYETSGRLGVMEREEGSSLPELFQSLPSSVFPMYHVFADFGEFAGGEVIPSVSSNPLQVEGICLLKGRKRRVMLAGFCNDSVQIVVRGLGRRVEIRYLDEANAAQAMSQPEAFRARPGEIQEVEGGEYLLHMRLHAIVRIDWEVE